MTKPNYFKMNSDYLALAQTGKAEFTAIFPSETFSPGQTYDRIQDFSVPYVSGAIDTFYISMNGASYKVGTLATLSVNNQFLYIIVQRVTNNKIRVRLHEFNNKTGGYTMPAQTAKVKVVSFRPPNLF